jgi:hypothetical protein
VTSNASFSLGKSDGAEYWRMPVESVARGPKIGGTVHSLAKPLLD